MMTTALLSADKYRPTTRANRSHGHQHRSDPTADVRVERRFYFFLVHTKQRSVRNQMPRNDKRYPISYYSLKT